MIDSLRYQAVLKLIGSDRMYAVSLDAFDRMGPDARDAMHLYAYYMLLAGG